MFILEKTKLSEDMLAVFKYLYQVEEGGNLLYVVCKGRARTNGLKLQET